MAEQKCPCCPRGCDLEHPSCERGRKYKETGEIPKSSHGAYNGNHGEHGGHPNHNGFLKFEDETQQMVMKYLHHACGIVDRGGFTQEMTEKMFTILSKEETSELAELLKKLSDYWISIAPQKR